VVTHAPDVAERTSRRITLHDGRVVENPVYPKQAALLETVGAGID
jgi:hypothetical protein